MSALVADLDCIDRPRKPLVGHRAGGVLRPGGSSIRSGPGASAVGTEVVGTSTIGEATGFRCSLLFRGRGHGRSGGQNDRCDDENELLHSGLLDRCAVWVRL